MALPSLFTPSPGDQSIMYLYGIFGSVNGVIAPGGGEGRGVMITLMGSLFRQFNTIILAVGVLVVVYTTVVGIMNTAHEGQFMGKNWNNLWIPIRTVMGIGLLVPTGSGYSGIQIVMMWVIVQGIGAADTLWGTALGYYATFGSVYAKTGVPTLQVKGSVRGLFQGLVCAKSAAATYDNPISGGDVKYYCAKKPGSDFCKKVGDPETFAPSFSDPAKTTFALGPDEACGKLSYCNYNQNCAGNPESLGCKTCQISQQTFKAAIPILAAIAERYVALDYEYMTYWSQARDAAKLPAAKRPKLTPPRFVQEYCNEKGDTQCINLPSPTGDDMSAPGPVIERLYWEYGLKEIMGSENGQKDFIGSIVADYTDATGGAVNDYIRSLAPKNPGALPPVLQGLNYFGWIFAGAGYFTISKGNAGIVGGILQPVSYTVDSSLLPSGRQPLVGYRNNYQAGQTLVCLATGGTDCGSIASGVMSGPYNGMMDVIGMWVDSLTADSDPLVGLMNQGETYFTIIEVIFWLYFAITIALAIVAMLAALQVIGTGLGVGAMPLIMEIHMIFTPIVFAIISFLLSLGTIYAIYIPLIPFTIFTLGAIGWMISTVEAMVAGPLVALGIMSPSGQHEVMGKAEPAIGLLFGIFLRPSLMIFGIFAAMLLSAQTVKFANMGFNMLKGSTTLSGAGMFKMVVMMTTQASFIVAILNKTFSIIYIIPERVLSWIGISVPHEGAGELSEVKGGTEKGAQQAEAMGKATQDTAQKGASAGATADDRKRKGDDKVNKSNPKMKGS